MKTLKDEQNYVRELKNKNVNLRWVIKKLEDELRMDLDLNYEVMKYMLLKYGAEPND